MKVLWSWLRELADVEARPDDVAHRLTFAGLEVEEIKPIEEPTPTVPAAPPPAGPDHLLEINVTPNRADCLSVFGLAREVRALLGRPPRNSRPARIAEQGPSLEGEIEVSVVHPDVCPRYMGRLVLNIRVGESPEWLRYRLRHMGLRPINNVVDVTNYVLLEYGQPLHAFDADRLAGRRIDVRRQEGEGHLLTLDGQRRSLQNGDVLICDGEHPIALGGIMGGLNTEIHPETRSVFIESAYFDASTIRRTSKRLKLQTESSYRFERGVDIQGVPKALDRCASLIREIAGGEIAQGRIDAYPRRVSRRKILFDPSSVKRHTGVRATAAECAATFERLGFALRRRPRGRLDVAAPSWRVDIEREIDLVEEVVRVKGFEHIPAVLPAVRLVPRAHAAEPSRSAEGLVRDILVSAGFQEVVSLPFVSAQILHVFGSGGETPAGAVGILNPLSEDLHYLRPSLLPSLLQALATNVHHGRRSLEIFEVGSIHTGGTGASTEPSEIPMAAGLLAAPPRPKREAFLEVKGFVETLLERLNTSDAALVAGSLPPWYVEGEGLVVTVGKNPIGWLGSVRSEIAARYDATGPVLAFELRLEPLLQRREVPRKARPLARFPSVVRDLSFIIDEGTTAESIRQGIASQRIAWLEEAQPFDEYRGPQIGPGKKGLTFRLRFQHPDKTLTEEEVNGALLQVREHLQTIGASLREAESGI
ncbi:MAG: phenylalanine--tRNA ligase subunit beta [Nitrospirae bacterium]|nr:phenylalanine--tRNA ligase subunit beta [Nitrospirota bacterium]